MFQNLVQNIIILVGWPILITGSIFIFIKGRNSYRYVRGSLIGKISKVLVFTVLVEIYGLGIITTILIFVEPRFTYLIAPIFVLWTVMFAWSLNTLEEAEKEMQKIIGIGKK